VEAHPLERLLEMLGVGVDRPGDQAGLRRQRRLSGLIGWSIVPDGLTS
jgi:hypothetical protein